MLRHANIHPGSGIGEEILEIPRYTGTTNVCYRSALTDNAILRVVGFVLDIQSITTTGAGVRIQVRHPNTPDPDGSGLTSNAYQGTLRAGAFVSDNFDSAGHYAWRAGPQDFHRSNNNQNLGPEFTLGHSTAGPIPSSEGFYGLGEQTSASGTVADNAVGQDKMVKQIELDLVTTSVTALDIWGYVIIERQNVGGQDFLGSYANRRAAD